jgi:hypothetical protein
MKHAPNGNSELNQVLKRATWRVFAFTAHWWHNRTKTPRKIVATRRMVAARFSLQNQGGK